MSWVNNIPYLKPFAQNATFLYPPKTSENRKVENGCIGDEWVNGKSKEG